MKKVVIKEFNFAEVDAPKETFGFLKIPTSHKIIRAEGENLEVSDGFHTFDELYEHRIKLFISLCYFYILGKRDNEEKNVWISKKHSDGTKFDGWFIMGIGKKKGEQITYHLPNKYWPAVELIAEILDKAPKYDGHTSEDVLKRLENLIDLQIFKKIK